MSTQPAAQKTITAVEIRTLKGKRAIACLTAYDYATARWCSEAQVDVLLVGDSLANVVYGESSTLPVTMDTMIGHSRAVSKGAGQCLVVGDLPFLSYQVSIEDAIRNAGRFLKEGGAHAVKLEGGLEMENTIAAIVRTGIPVMAHIGLTPQSIHAMGGYKMHGKTAAERDVLLANAQAVTRAGAFAVVLECVEESLAAEITASISIPTIGIGSGNGCDGQILVTQDLLGLTEGRVPKFVNPTGAFRAPIVEAIRAYVQRTQAK
jgi:3-methyl-2-oxobutanoate hydroxymethyltransferase